MASLKLRSQNKANGYICGGGEKGTGKGDKVGGDGNLKHFIHA